MRIQHTTAVIFAADDTPDAHVTFPELGGDFGVAVHLTGRDVTFYGRDRETVAAALLTVVAALNDTAIAAQSDEVH